MRRYAPPAVTAPEIRLGRIPRGYLGTLRTAAQVKRLIRAGAKDFYVRQHAIDVLLQRGVRPKDYLAEIAALFQWVQRHVRYTKDPYRVEVLHSPRRMLELRAGDCDDMTILLGSMLESIGHPVRLVLTGPDPSRPTLFSHIYLETQHQGRWIPCDATMPHPLGWAPRTLVKRIIPFQEEPKHVNRRDGIGRDERPGMAPGADPRHRARRRAAEGPPDQVALDPAQRSGPPGPEPVGRPAAPLRLGERTPPAAAAQDGAPFGASAPALGNPSGGAGPGRDPGAADDPSPRLGPSPLGGPTGVSAAPGLAGASSAAGPAGPPSPSAPAGAGAAHRAGASDRPRRPALTARADTADPAALDGSLREGTELFRRFARFGPDRVRRVAHGRVMPPVVVELGRLVGLIYRSDKWQAGRPRTYIHIMRDPPSLASDIQGRQLFLVGGSYRVTPGGIEG